VLVRGQAQEHLRGLIGRQSVQRDQHSRWQVAKVAAAGDQDHAAWRSRQQRLRAGGPVPAGARSWALGPRDVVLVDEAGMAGTFLLDNLVAIAAARGTVVRLLGDDRQLGAVESGGALRLIAAQPGTPRAVQSFRQHRTITPVLCMATGRIVRVSPAAGGGRGVCGQEDG